MASTFRSFSVVALSVFSACSVGHALADPPDGGRSAVRLPDGIYRLLRQGRTVQEVSPLAPGEVAVPDREPYRREGSGDVVRYLVVHRMPDVPLALKEKPRTAKDDGGRVRIYLTLRRDAAEKLAHITRTSAGARLAILVGGHVVTVHKVRSPILDGKVQISGCAENSTEYLIGQLRRAQERD